MSDIIESGPSLLLGRKKVCSMLGITVREFYALIQGQKLHPLQTKSGQHRVPLAEVIALKAEFSRRAVVLPYEKFIRAASHFTSTTNQVNDRLEDLGFIRAPNEYIERVRVQEQNHPDLSLVRVGSIHEFFKALGRVEEIARRRDIRLLVESLHMIARGEEEIRQIVRAKFGTDFEPAEIQKYIEYFYNWRIVDVDSVKFYFDFLSGRERLVKECAYRRADYFIFYALGIDFGGEIAELLERSCLGLLHKLNLFIEGYVYGDMQVSQRDLQQLAEIISTILGAAKDVRQGKVSKKDQETIVDKLLPKAVTRDNFFKAERELNFDAKPPL